jgi:hypothetical protein
MGCMALNVRLQRYFSSDDQCVIYMSACLKFRGVMHNFVFNRCKQLDYHMISFVNTDDQIINTYIHTSSMHFIVETTIHT